VAENLLMGTAAQESHLGTYLAQLGGGPALGIFQMEPATHQDIWDNFLRYKTYIRAGVLEGVPPTHREPSQSAAHASLLIHDLSYATAMARIHYLRVSEALPADPDDVEALGTYWKNHYNTHRGRGTVAEFVSNYAEFIE
tara:strand:+ start:1940 stop:2359 length:420 start_codon:yes stop_codon:yes gene_type:complete